jgi:23S rRNA pseudouridine2457 synthase
MKYIAFFKPYGVLSSFTHEAKSANNGKEATTKRTLSEFHLPKNVYAAGRLDFDSEGLLLLSDDGNFIHRVTDPRHKKPKTYLAQVEGAPTEEALIALRRGIALKDYTTLPCKARVLSEAPILPPRDTPITPHGSTAWLEIILIEGKKRQVRHMTAAVGLPTLRLVRITIGEISAAGLQPGKWRELTKPELASII